MNLIFESYTSKDPARAAELERVRAINADSGVFERIVPVAEGGRKTYADLIALAVNRFPGEVCVIANSDIAFDASLVSAADWLREAHNKKKPSLVVLTRWDTPTSPSMEGRVDAASWKFFSHSQDTWMFIAGSLPAFDAGFTRGIPACESRLAYEAWSAGVVDRQSCLDGAHLAPSRLGRSHLETCRQLQKPVLFSAAHDARRNYL